MSSSQWPPNNQVFDYANFAAFPATALNGTLALALDTDILYAYNTGSASWVIIGGPGAALSIGTIDSQTASANGAVIHSDALIMQSASATVPGLVNNTTQIMSGAKTFNTSISSPTSKLTGATSGTLSFSVPATVTSYPLVWPSGQGGISTFLKNDGSGGLSWAAGSGGSGVDSIGTIDSQSKSADGLVISGTTLYAQTADDTFPGLVSNAAQTLSGAKTFSTPPILSSLTISLPLQLDASKNIVSAAIDLSTAEATGVLATARFPALTGDITTISGAVATTLATVNSNVGSFTNAAITVNGKGLVTAASSGTTGNLTDAGTDGIIVTNGSGAVLGSGTSLAQHVADTTHNGYLSSTDWNTFNGKQASGSYITALTSDVTASGPGSVAATLATVNTDVGSFGSSTSIPSITVNGKGLVTAASGNAVVAPAGTLSGTTLNSTVVTSSLTTVGTIGTGVWNGTTIAIANGGTGQTTKTAAFDALQPMTTGGDIIYGGASGTATRLANGTNGQVLTSSGGTSAPTWKATLLGSKNYLSAYNGNPGNGDFELGNTNNFALGTVTLTSGLPTGVPTFGSGNNGNLTLSTISSSQLAGNYSMGYVSAAATTAGDFVASSAFTIDLEDQAKVMTFKFYYTPHTNPTNSNWSGTSSNSFGVAIYDVTASAWIVPAGVWAMTQSTGVGLATGTFQTTSSSTQYRIVVYNANATSGATTLYFDDFFLGPNTAPIGPVVTDFQTFTPTGTLITNSTYTGQWKRIGDQMQVNFKIALSGSPGSVSPINVNLPSGYTIDTTKLPSTSGSETEFLGTGDYLNAVDGVRYSLIIGYVSTTAVTLKSQALTNSANSTAAFSNSSPRTMAASDTIIGTFTVPIVGWSSNVQMSNDTDTRIIEGRISGGGSQTAVAPNNSAVQITSTCLSATVTDSAGSWSSGNSNWVIPVSGYYIFPCALLVSGTNVLNNQYRIQIFVNGSLDSDIGPVQQAPTAGAGINLFGTSPPIKLNAGDTVDMRLFGGGDNSTNKLTVGGSVSRTYFGMLRLSGPAVIAATESVNARYFSSTSSVGTTGSPLTITYATKDFDSHNAYASGTYTIPVSGKYQVNAGLYQTAATTAANQESLLQINKNGSAYSSNAAFFTSTTSKPLSGVVSDIVNCLAGDTIVIVAGNAGTTPSVSASNTFNYLSICRVGN